eukprot:CAMPEP_0168402662 /NCGR_PEP_ID=MMETSP0228-20121227/23734_1 /TAXON_ID=133427 /ORGANISM="Protoceratium reticulatum, Strain CCCM 535 (=CCMP 1889)" /LENGTH=229 /DNA_ID=CAMNT_0008416251 /DNA_START=156 /DNA_END=845 /DNA_ORIENTATION=+
MVGMAEVFDKTWFVALVMAMRHDRNTVFWGCFAALLIHVFIAAVCGYSMSRLLSHRVLDFFAAGLYTMFTILYTYDWYNTSSDSDILAASKEEAAASLPEEGSAGGGGAGYGALKGAQSRGGGKASLPSLGRLFWQCFVAVFIAEWGDRTQIAMIGIHASQPLVPVMLGSTLAFGVLTLSAVCLGVVLRDRTLNEAAIKGLCALSFAFFAVVAIRDALHAPAGAITGLK